jgi:CheY-like chemotaxis protein
VVLDLKMPGMDGLTVLKQVRSLNPTQPVIVLTGAGTPDSEQQIRALGGDRVRGKTVLAASTGGRAEAPAHAC